MFLLEKPSALMLLLGGCAFCSCYLVALAVYRLYLSSLAKFPGPKLAALTHWYGFYFAVILPGQFTFHIQDLHKQYGKSIMPPPLFARNPSHTHQRRTHHPHLPRRAPHSRSFLLAVPLRRSRAPRQIRANVHRLRLPQQRLRNPVPPSASAAPISAERMVQQEADP